MIQKDQLTHLKPVLALHGYTFELPSEPGKYICEFQVFSGKLQISHDSYNGYSGLWYGEAGTTKERVFYLEAGEKSTLVFFNKIHDFQPDHVTVANRSFTRSASFTCHIQMENLT